MSEKMALLFLCFNVVLNLLIAQPKIVRQPNSLTVNVNEKLELQCFAKCIPEPPERQWFYCAPNSTSPILLKGKKSWKLVIDKARTNNTGYYCCRVQNRRLKEDKYAVFSDYAEVIVKDNTHTELGMLLTVTIKLRYCVLHL